MKSTQYTYTGIFFLFSKKKEMQVISSMAKAISIYTWIHANTRVRETKKVMHVDMVSQPISETQTCSMRGHFSIIRYTESEYTLIQKMVTNTSLSIKTATKMAK